MERGSRMEALGASQMSKPADSGDCSSLCLLALALHPFPMPFGKVKEEAVFVPGTAW